MSFIFILYVLGCLFTIVYFIRKGTEKAKKLEKQKTKKRSKTKKKSLAIMIHLDGGDEYENGKSFKVKKDQKLYDYTDENGKKVLKKDWDYDFWQITSNKSNHVFEWLREDQNNNNTSTLNFWKGGDLSDIRKNISEDIAIDVIIESDWVPGMEKLLSKKKESSVNKLEWSKIDKNNTKKVISKELDTRTKPERKSKGFGQASSNTNSRSKGHGETIS